MATTKLVPAHENNAAAAAAEDDCIDMDISSATLFCYATANTQCSSSPPHHSIEFEFQMSLNPLQRGGEETTPSPADELFYKGKLLPLHLPPRMQMVENLLHCNSADMFHRANISAVPSSCYVSGGELNPEDYGHFRECSGISQKKKSRSWYSEKLKSMSQSNLGRTMMKASRACIKSLFSKSSSPSSSSKPKACSSGHLNPTTLLKSIQRERLADEELLHRKSFSGAINWHSTTKSSSSAMTPTSCSSSSSSCSSFSSVNSGGFYGPLVLKRSSSVNSEAESPIEGAIAHCKKSQQQARKSASDVGSYTLTASKIVSACENKERPGLCRG